MKHHSAHRFFHVTAPAYVPACIFLFVLFATILSGCMSSDHSDAILVEGNLKLEVQTPGEVYIDRELVGTAEPGIVFEKELNHGRHRLELRYEDGKKEKQRIEIPALTDLEVVFSYLPGEIKEYMNLIDEKFDAGEWMEALQLLDRGMEEKLIYRPYYMEKRRATLAALENDLAATFHQEQWSSWLELYRRAAEAGEIAEEKYREQLARALEGKAKEEIESALERRQWREALDLLEEAHRSDLLTSTWYRDGKKKAETEAKAEETFRAAVMADFVVVPGGIFEMGHAYRGGKDAQKVHEVYVSDFAISKYEVSRGLYRKVMEKNPEGPQSSTGPDYPVESLSWWEAIEFCNALSERTGLEPVYTIDGGEASWDGSRNGFRLPTEAEWEYAARGGLQSRGHHYAGSDEVDEVAWYMKNSGEKSHTPGEKKPNELKLYDMSGNVSEWCWDWYDERYYRKSPEKDPTGPPSGKTRVIRGGGYNSSIAWPNVYARGDRNPEVDYFRGLGLRLVRNEIQ